MSLFETEHPLGQDLEKLHQALIAGMAENKDLLGNNVELRFYDALSNGNGVSILKLASWATKNQVFMELPLVVPEGDDTWTADWGAGLEPVLYRFRVQDMLGRGFNLPWVGEDSSEPVHTKYLNFNVMGEGIALVINRESKDETYYGHFESEVYDLFNALARREASIGELAILADAA